MKTLLLSASALVLTGGMALAQTPNSTAPRNRHVTEQMRSGGAAPMVAHVTGGSSSNSAFVNTGGNPTFNSGALSKTRSAGISGNAKITAHNGVVMKNNGAASADARQIPEAASASRYLEIAGNAVASHQQARAHRALGHAETDLRAKSSSKRLNGHLDTTAAATVREARHAVATGDYARASSLIHKAMDQARGQA